MNDKYYKKYLKYKNKYLKLMNKQFGGSNRKKKVEKSKGRQIRQQEKEAYVEFITNNIRLLEGHTTWKKILSTIKNKNEKAGEIGYTMNQIQCLKVLKETGFGLLTKDEDFKLDEKDIDFLEKTEVSIQEIEKIPNTTRWIESIFTELSESWKGRAPDRKRSFLYVLLTLKENISMLSLLKQFNEIKDFINKKQLDSKILNLCGNWGDSIRPEEKKSLCNKHRQYKETAVAPWDCKWVEELKDCVPTNTSKSLYYDESKAESTDESKADRNDNQLAKKSTEKLKTHTLKQKRKKYMENLDSIIESYNKNKCPRLVDAINKKNWVENNKMWNEKLKLVNWLNGFPFDAKWWEPLYGEIVGHQKIKTWHSTEEKIKILETLPGPGLLKYIAEANKEFCFREYFIKDYLIDQLTKSHEFLDEQNKILKFGICIKGLEGLKITLTAEEIATLRSSISEKVSSIEDLVQILKKKVKEFFKDPELLVEANIETIGDLIKLIERAEKLNVLRDFNLESYKNRLLELEHNEENRLLQLEKNVLTLKEGMPGIKKQAEVKKLVEEIKKDGLDISKIEELLKRSEFLKEIPKQINIENLIKQKNDIDSLLELLVNENIKKLTELNEKIGEKAEANIEEILEKQLTEAINNLKWEEFDVEDKAKEKNWVEKIETKKEIEELFKKKKTTLFLEKIATFEEEKNIDTLVKNEIQKKRTGIIELDLLGPGALLSQINKIKKNLKEKNEKEQREQKMQEKMKDYEELSSKDKILYFYKLLDDFINSRVN